MDVDSEIKLLKEYLNIYIQLLPDSTMCGGLRIHRPQMPTFDYFKENYYAFCEPQYKESKDIYSNSVSNVYTHGLGSINGIAYRYYNYWHGVKYFTGGNLKGDYTIVYDRLNNILKQH